MYAQGEQKATLPQDRPLAPTRDQAKSAVLNSLRSPRSRRKLRIRDGAGPHEMGIEFGWVTARRS